jgi:acyl carrier protein
MTMDCDSQKIREGVIQALAKCLARNASEIRGEHLLINDLGLDSLDFLDLMFALEKTFAVRIRDEDFNRLLKPTQNDSLPPHLSAEEVKAMAQFIPGLEQKAQSCPIARNSVLSLMTADSLARLVAHKLGSGGRTG